MATILTVGKLPYLNNRLTNRHIISCHNAPLHPTDQSKFEFLNCKMADNHLLKNRKITRSKQQFNHCVEILHGDLYWPSERS